MDKKKESKSKLKSGAVESEEKVIAKSECAGATNNLKDSLVKCEVKLDVGDWVSPPAGATFKIDSDANFPEINFEIATIAPGPYQWSWEIRWSALACPQRKGRRRFKPKKSQLYSMKDQFVSGSQQWKASLKNAIVGGELIVKVQVGSKTFVRAVSIVGSEPGESRVMVELAKYSTSQPRDVELAKKIFQQESKFSQFYSDDEPLVSFDNGYGLGQATTPVPSFEQVWNWKEHIKYIVTIVLKEKRAFAKAYLDKHSGYTNDDLDTETLVHYNGANYHYLVWDTESKKWTKNNSVLCDPEQSNTGWDMSTAGNQNKSLVQLRAGEGNKPKYTGRCYAEHIKNQGATK